MDKDIKEIADKDIKVAGYMSPAEMIKMIKMILAEEMGAMYRIERDGLKIKFVNGQKFRIKVEEIK